MNVTLSLVGLRDKQIRDMSSDVILVADRITAEDFLKPNRFVSVVLRELQGMV